MMIPAVLFAIALVMTVINVYLDRSLGAALWGFSTAAWLINMLEARK